MHEIKYSGVKYRPDDETWTEIFSFGSHQSAHKTTLSWLHCQKCKKPTYRGCNLLSLNEVINIKSCIIQVSILENGRRRDVLICAIIQTATSRRHASPGSNTIRPHPGKADSSLQADQSIPKPQVCLVTGGVLNGVSAQLLDGRKSYICSGGLPLMSLFIWRLLLFV